jgi:trk system potassium uptake protein TrkA
MYIIIVGGGGVGYYLAKALLSQGHEVLVLEKNPKSIERFEDELGSICTRGDGCEVTTLASSGTSRADVFIAITNEDEDNLVSCQMAKYKFNVPRTIARVNNPKNEDVFKKLGIDVTLSVTNLILQNIEEELPSYPLVHLYNMKDEGTEIVEVKLLEQAKAIGKSVKDLKLPADSYLFLLFRNGDKPRMMNEDTDLQANDRIIALTPTESEEALREELIGLPAS